MSRVEQTAKSTLITLKRRCHQSVPDDADDATSKENESSKHKCEQATSEG